MAGAQDRTVIIDRYNHACSAYQSATAAFKRGSVEEYEAGLVAAAQAAWNVLEWAVRFYLEHDCIQQLSSEERESLKKTQFDDWVRLLGRLKPPVDQVTRNQLRQHRTLRNKNAHDGMLPGQRPVLAALTSARRFLVQRMLIPAEQLLEAVADEPSALQPPSVPPDPFASPPEEPTFGEHRKLGLQNWLEQAAAKGIAAARVRRGGRYDATLDSLALEARALLTRDAVAMCLASHGPDDLLVASESSVEEEVQRILAGPATQLDADSVQRLRQLVPLIQRRTSLCVDAGWLKPQDHSVAFAAPTLAVLLVGAAIAGRGNDSPALRALVGERLDWAEAGWAAVSAGDDVHRWATLLLETPPSPSLLSRVLATASAFGAAPKQTIATDSLIHAYRLCVLTLVWCSPVQTNAFGEKQEVDCPWYLPATAWRRAIFDLAHISAVLKTDDRLLIASPGLRQLPAPLNVIIKSLGLPLRLKEEQATAVVSLCAPYQAARTARFDERRFGALSSHDTHQLIGSNLHRSWFESFGIPALWSWDRVRASRLLAMPGDNRPAALLLNCPEMHRAWVRSWRVLAGTASSDELASAWVECALVLVHHRDKESLDLVRLGFETIDSRGLGEEVRRRILTRLEPPAQDPTDASEPSPVLVDILRRVVDTPSHFEKMVEDWTKRPALAWRTLLAAGCPDVAIARWCITKLAAHAAAPPGYRDGPVGIISSPGLQALSTGDWQLAFSQAREALEWLLDHGSTSSISILADACTPAGGERPTVNPSMGKIPQANIQMPLSMVIWGRVIERVEGRAAFYSLIESGRGPASPWFAKNEPLPKTEETLWLQLLGALAHQHAPSPSTKNDRSGGWVPSAALRLEATRLFACFELRALQDPGIVRLNGQPVRASVAAVAANCGVDVSVPLSDLLNELTRETDSTVWKLSMTCMPASMALGQLARFHPDCAAPLLKSALNQKLLLAMRRDDTVHFWAAMFAHHGSKQVLHELETQGVREFGLGVFDALQVVDEQALHEWQLHPAMLRPALLRAAEGRFLPGEEFWKRAWCVERKPEDLPELVVFLDGPWLTMLLNQSVSWSSPARRELLRCLARYSMADGVRARCLATLHEMNAVESAAPSQNPA